MVGDGHRGGAGTGGALACFTGEDGSLVGDEGAGSEDSDVTLELFSDSGGTSGGLGGGAGLGGEAGRFGGEEGGGHEGRAGLGGELGAGMNGMLPSKDGKRGTLTGLPASGWPAVVLTGLPIRLGYELATLRD